ncbi:P-loop containing nucleoside triphosphate hydrolase protein [Massariosphaeria phaeospora]|uniref:P-loop containing nucleoside triphosphate hydrolase protein n=1 Tax=Massariosphaeria phaeospora TaxID=100035 RepID=A0A7C8MUF3_9PLEO|nr:P-loop containing nucleoside triphosphate hydrolase protein [Massariosphaeria phaeospora]
MPPPHRSIVVLGESAVGKTCFTDIFIQNTHFAFYDPTLLHTSCAALTLDDDANLPWDLYLTDISSTIFREDPRDLPLNFLTFKTLLERADGVVLLYDITSLPSFTHVTTSGLAVVAANRRAVRKEDGAAYPEAAGQRFGCVLVGTKADLVESGEGRRQVGMEDARAWALGKGWNAFEVDTKKREQVVEVLREVVRSVMRAEKLDREGVEEAAIRTEEAERMRLENEEAKREDTNNNKERSMFAALGDSVKRVIPKAKSGR